MWSKARSALQRYFGYEDFRPGQRETIAAVLAGRDSLVVMPTGAGKSLCYQVPALILDGVTLVVSPLIALMRDQVAALDALGVPAAFVNSALSRQEIDERLAAAVAGRLRLLYLAPERFGSRAFRRALSRMRVPLVAIDEAHCISEWGHDFRPSYLKLRNFWPELGHPTLVAVTATATPEVRRDITAQLDLRRPALIVRGFDRPNLRWTVGRHDRLSEKSRLLLSLVERADGSGLVYASTRKMVEAAAELLRGSGVQAAAYHGGLPRKRRTRVQEAWMDGAIPVVVATNAFGMGIDKEDVRFVIHFQMPGSLESYYQEAGRAGRDGEPAECVLLHSYRDRFTHEFFIRSAHPERELVCAAYRALCRAHQASGTLVRGMRIVQMLSGRADERTVYSALRVLVDAGVVERRADGSGYLIRWIARPDEILADLAENRLPGLPVHTEELVRGLLRAPGSERRLVQVSGAALRSWTGIDDEDVRTMLDALQSYGRLGWRDRGRTAGYALTETPCAETDLPVDWSRLSARRQLELTKLRRMERYAFQEGCRRRYLLRYFGESYGHGSCHACDRCGDRAAR